MLCPFCVLEILLRFVYVCTSFLLFFHYHVGTVFFFPRLSLRWCDVSYNAIYTSTRVLVHNSFRLSLKGLFADFTWGVQRTVSDAEIRSTLRVFLLFQPLWPLRFN